MAKDYPGIIFAGSYSHPFKTEFSEEDNRMRIEAINQAHPDLWVGMTAPKQEKWIFQNKERLDVKFIGAIGAVFDFYTGNVMTTGEAGGHDFKTGGMRKTPKRGHIEQSLVFIDRINPGEMVFNFTGQDFLDLLFFSVFGRD